MRLQATLTAIGAALALTAPAHAATVVIDNFTTAQTHTIGADGATDSVAGSGIIGGAREVTLFNDSSPDGALDTIFLTEFGDARFESGAGVASRFVMSYDGSADGSFDPNGLGGVDLVDGNNGMFQISSNFVDENATVTFEVWDTFGNVASAMIDVFDDTPATYKLLFSSFLGVDFTSVGAIRTTIDSATAADISFSAIEATAVPVPPAALLFVPALAGMVAFRKRRAV